MVKDGNQPIESLRIPIEWHYPEDQISRYASNIIVQHGRREFILSFFEVRSPVLLGSPEEREEAARSLESVRAECVARIIVAPDALQEFIEVMQDNLRNYRLQIDE